MSGGLFDFDALEEALEKTSSTAASVPGSAASDDGGGGSSSGEEDGLSEVWPDDVPNDLDLLAADDEARADEAPLGPERRNGTADDSNGDDAPKAWEVVFSRVVMRVEPQLDAAVVGICSQSEIVFEDSAVRSLDPSWVKVLGSNGFILKDGRVKDPKLGVLLKPFSMPAYMQVSASAMPQVLRALRDMWTKARSQTNFLNPSDIRRLRKATDDAATRARKSPSGRFDAKVFEEALASDPALAPRAGPAPGGGGAAASAAAAAAAAAGPGNAGGPLAFGQGLVGTSGGLGGGTWDHAAPRLPRHNPFAGVGFGGADVKTLAVAAWRTPGAAANVSSSNESGWGLRLTPVVVRGLVRSMARRSLPCAEDTEALLVEVARIFSAQPSLTRLHVPPSATLHVVGDLHGQFWDFLQVIDRFGEPSPTNMYLFNGDLVDRGAFSVEVALAVFAWKLALPEYVHVNRGNHEALRMNTLFGFQAEAKLKYNEKVFGLFGAAFRGLPLAAVVNDSVFVVHGGLSSQLGFRLSAVAAVVRGREPEDSDELMVDLLWSDPMEATGILRSPRGGGVLFGPDVTRRFCEDNKLLCVIRSHEMKSEGYEWAHDKRCLTLFSAANYCGVCGNDGAVCDIVPRSGSHRLGLADLHLRTFEATEPPASAGPPRPRLGFGFGGLV